jgi:branched-chain amino acid transport system permease protein
MGGYPPDLPALQAFAGLALGAVYVLLALGLSLIFGMLGVVNFAHGALFALGAYVGVFLLGLGWNFWAALVAVPLAVGALGLLVERFLVRRLYCSVSLQLMGRGCGAWPGPDQW